MSDIDLKALREAAVRAAEWQAAGCPVDDEHDTYPDEILGMYTSPANLIALLDRLESATEMATKHDQMLQLVGSAVGMPAGSNLHSELMPVVHALRKDVAPELDHVIKWLANGCSVPHAIEELSIYKARIDAAIAQDAGAETPDRNTGNGVDAGVEGGAEVAQEGGK